MSSETGILHGIRVVETASMIMVPSVGALMSDYGAEVIKVEPLEGDLNRRGHHLPGMPESEYGYCFLPDNRNKKSVALDLKSEEGRAILLRLLRDADVFLTNYRPAALDRLKLSYDHLKDDNPRLIYALGTGYGERGPEAQKPGFDSVCYWARSALEASMFPIEGWLGPLTYGSGDHPSGMALFGAVMLALLARVQTGRGCKVSSSLLANGAWSNSVTIQAKLCDAQFHPRRPREEALNFTSVYYRAGDGRIFKMTVVDVEQGWPRICRAIGRPDLIEDPRYATLEVRRGHMSELIELCDEIFATQDMAYWKRALEEADVPFSIIATYDDVVADEQMAATDVFVEVEDPDIGRVRTVNSPLSIDGHPKRAPEAAPRLGADTRQVLAELDFDEAKIEALLARGVAGAS